LPQLTFIQYELSIKVELNRDDVGASFLEGLPRRRVEQPSVTGRSTVPMNDPGYTSMPAFYSLDSNATPPRTGGHAPAPNHNQVDIMRIRLGLDVRTTVSHLRVIFYLC
jgi:hypothetical protein